MTEKVALGLMHGGLLTKDVSRPPPDFWTFFEVPRVV
jgi:hypothetical protein